MSESNDPRTDELRRAAASTSPTPRKSDAIYFEMRAVVERRRSEAAACLSAATAHAELAAAYAYRARAARDDDAPADDSTPAASA